RLIVKCTCPYFERSIEPCKHIWAAILAADQASRFHVPADLSLDFYDGPTGAPDPDDAGDGYLDSEVTPELRESAERPGVRGFTAAQRGAIADRRTQYWSERRRRMADPPRPAAPPAWQTFLSHVTPSQNDGVPTRALHTGELVYV